MRMVRCYECGKSYDYDDDGFCPRCGAFNQPAKTAAAVRTAPGEAAPAAGNGKKQLQRDLEASLKQVEQAMTEFLGGGPRGPRLPGGHR